ncbi:hypothetical protein HMPREF1556_01535 [Porphyromonas sp. oral taxon 278 str. W7784]|nr:hypothetical protein HMPREF1556_01535 [Porphyromonas sp. oral taxon 278 str. W7784]
MRQGPCTHLSQRHFGGLGLAHLESKYQLSAFSLSLLRLSRERVRLFINL